MATGDSASLTIGANTEPAKAEIQSLADALTNMARQANKAGTDATKAFEGQGRGIRSIKNQADNLLAEYVSMGDAISKIEAKASIKGIDISPLKGLLDIVRQAKAAFDQLVLSEREAASSARQAASDVASFNKQIDTNLARAQSGLSAQSGDYYKNLASVRGITIDDSANQKLLMTDSLNAANQKTVAYNREAERIARQVETQTRNLMNSIENTANNLATSGMTASQAFEYRIQKAGLDMTQFQPAINELKAAEQQFAKVNGQVKDGDQFFQKYGMSAKQYAASLRGVPAQITDIVVSLQGGQRPLTVLLQQGGQLKDMFGGVLPAAKALGSTLLTMINPATVLATVIGTLGVAIYQGADESDRLNQALIKTGGAAGMSASELSSLAEQAGNVSGRYSAAREAIEAMASSGKMTSAEITEAMRGIDAAATVTGKSVTEIAESFVKVAEKPSDAVLKLNDGVNFLTASTYRQIVALEKQGKMQEAALVAMKAYNDEMLDRAPEMEKHLGYIESGWRNVKDAILDAWDTLKSFGREDAYFDVKDYTQRLANARMGGDAQQIAEFEKKLADAQKRYDELSVSARKTGEEIRKQNDELQKAVKEVKESGKRKSDPEKSYYQSTYETITRQIEQLKLEAQQEGALTNAQKLRIQIENQAADSKKKLTAVHKEYLNKQLDELEVLERAASDRKFIKDYEKQYRDELDKTVRSYEDQIAVVGMSTEKAEMYRKELEIMRDAYNRIEDAEKKGILPEGYDAKILEDARNQIGLMLQKQQELKDVRNDPWLALKESLETYKESARDAGTQIRDFAKNTFQSMEDAFVKFATTGKLSFSDLIDSIIADIARMYAKKATASLFDALFQLGGQTIASGLGSISGSSSSGSSGVGFKYDANKFASGLQFRASGGPVSGKSAYIVGEQGPELFVPNTSGQILPNGSFGGTNGINVQISHKNEGTPQQVMDTSADFDGKNLIIKIVTQDIQNDGMISRTMSKTFGMRRAAGAM
nr:MAG TPA: tail tape measure protein [Caudoviricetes sp.]